MSHIEQNCLLVNRVRGYSYPDPHNLVHLETILKSYHEFRPCYSYASNLFFLFFTFLGNWDNYVNHK